MARSARIPEGDDIEWFEDLDLSGGSYDHRPAYLAMIEKMRAGAFVGIVAYDLSRLHRDTSNALALRDECANLGVILRTDDSNLTAHEELNEPSHKLMFTVRAGVGDYEREKIRKRGREGARVEFEAGGPRGADWFGYVTALNPARRVLRHLPKTGATRRRCGISRASSSWSAQESVALR